MKFHTAESRENAIPDNLCKAEYKDDEVHQIHNSIKDRITYSHIIHLASGLICYGVPHLRCP